MNDAPQESATEQPVEGTPEILNQSTDSVAEPSARPE